MLLRYTGQLPVTFTSIGLEVVPGDEFEVPDEVAAAFAVRADIQAAAAGRLPKGRRSKPDGDPPSPPAGDSTPAGPVPDPTEAP